MSKLQFVILVQLVVSADIPQVACLVAETTSTESGMTTVLTPSLLPTLIFMLTFDQLAVLSCVDGSVCARFDLS